MSENKLEGKRDNAGKLQWKLMPFDALEETVRVLEFGAQKYSPNNWKKGFEWMSIYNSLCRHLFAWGNGEDKDPETGLSHMAHAMCNVLFLSWYIKHNKGVDDRDKYHLEMVLQGVSDRLTKPEGNESKSENDNTTS